MYEKLTNMMNYRFQWAHKVWGHGKGTTWSTLSLTTIIIRNLEVQVQYNTCEHYICFRLGEGSDAWKWRRRLLAWEEELIGEY